MPNRGRRLILNKASLCFIWSIGQLSLLVGVCIGSIQQALKKRDEGHVGLVSLRSEKYVCRIYVHKLF